MSRLRCGGQRFASPAKAGGNKPQGESVETGASETPLNIAPRTASSRGKETSTALTWVSAGVFGIGVRCFSSCGTRARPGDNFVKAMAKAGFTVELFTRADSLVSRRNRGSRQTPRETRGFIWTTCPCIGWRLVLADPFGKPAARLPSPQATFLLMSNEHHGFPARHRPPAARACCSPPAELKRFFRRPTSKVKHGVSGPGRSKPELCTAA